MHNEFEALWIRPYHIEKVIDFNSLFIRDLDENVLKFLVEWHHVKHFFT